MVTVKIPPSSLVLDISLNDFSSQEDGYYMQLQSFCTCIIMHDDAMGLSWIYYLLLETKEQLNQAGLETTILLNRICLLLPVPPRSKRRRLYDSTSRSWSTWLADVSSKPDMCQLPCRRTEPSKSTIYFIEVLAESKFVIVTRYH
jgi:hypothetical protein